MLIKYLFPYLFPKFCFLRKIFYDYRCSLEGRFYYLNLFVQYHPGCQKNLSKSDREYFGKYFQPDLLKLI